MKCLRSETFLEGEMDIKQLERLVRNYLNKDEIILNTKAKEQTFARVLSELHHYNNTDPGALENLRQEFIGRYLVSVMKKAQENSNFVKKAAIRNQNRKRKKYVSKRISRKSKRI